MVIWRQHYSRTGSPLQQQRADRGRQLAGHDSEWAGQFSEGFISVAQCRPGWISKCGTSPGLLTRNSPSECRASARFAAEGELTINGGLAAPRFGIDLRLSSVVDCPAPSNHGSIEFAALSVADRDDPAITVPISLFAFHPSIAGHLA